MLEIIPHLTSEQEEYLSSFLNTRHCYYNMSLADTRLLTRLNLPVKQEYMANILFKAVGGESDPPITVNNIVKDPNSCCKEMPGLRSDTHLYYGRSLNIWSHAPVDNHNEYRDLEATIRWLKFIDEKIFPYWGVKLAGEVVYLSYMLFIKDHSILGVAYESNRG